MKLQSSQSTILESIQQDQNLTERLSIQATQHRQIGELISAQQSMKLLAWLFWQCVMIQMSFLILYFRENYRLGEVEDLIPS